MVKKDKVKPYILNVAEIIYLAIFDIKKSNPKLTNIEAIELFIGSEKYNKISSGKFHDDWFDDLKKNILAKKLNNQIQICGYTNQPEIEIQNSNYLIFTSINEFYGFSLIESLVNSTPVITVKKGSFVELNDRTCGMFIDIDDYDETLRFLEYLTRIKQKEYLKLCQSAFQSAEEKFNIEKNVNDFILNIQK